jgi:hypothetical protein
MFLFHVFRSFLPLHNPLGFGASDFIELLVALLMVLLILTGRSLIAPWLLKIAQQTPWCMLLLALLCVALRLLLLPHHPIPSPTVSDEFSHLLLADTLLHGRLANPSHALHQFFETYFVLQEPTYSSIYAMGQGMLLAIGQIIVGYWWAGVLISTAVFCALCYWMLRAWLTPGWALIGGFLAVMQFGPLNQWTNSYWGGMLSAIAGCLVFGALPRLRKTGQMRYAALSGLGLALQLLTRPYESVFLMLSAGIFLLPGPRKLARAGAVMVLVVIPAIGLTLLQNKRVTGSWTTLPYMVSRYQYAVPTTFTFQPNPMPHRELTHEQELDYQVQLTIHGKDTDTAVEYGKRLLRRVRVYRFFFLAPLYVILPAFFAALREWRFRWVLLTVLIFSLGANFYPYFYPHYIAAITSLFVLMSVAAQERLSRLYIRGWPAGRQAASLVLIFCAVHFLFWYSLHLFENREFSMDLMRYETWDAINHDDPEGRILVNNQLAQSPGMQLVFVRYWPQHMFEEWVHNLADIDASRVVWARDLGPAENEKLERYYPNHTEWLLEPDAKPPRLSRYAAAAQRKIEP